MHVSPLSWPMAMLTLTSGPAPCPAPGSFPFRPTRSAPRAGLRQPGLAGTHPDPSICRVGEDFYLVTSSFAPWPAKRWRASGTGARRGGASPYDEFRRDLLPFRPLAAQHPHQLLDGGPAEVGEVLADRGQCGDQVSGALHVV